MRRREIAVLLAVSMLAVNVCSVCAAGVESDAAVAAETGSEDEILCEDEIEEIIGDYFCEENPFEISDLERSQAFEVTSVDDSDTTTNMYILSDGGQTVGSLYVMENDGQVFSSIVLGSSEILDKAIAAEESVAFVSDEDRVYLAEDGHMTALYSDVTTDNSVDVELTEEPVELQPVTASVSATSHNTTPQPSTSQSVSIKTYNSINVMGQYGNYTNFRFRQVGYVATPTFSGTSMSWIASAVALLRYKYSSCSSLTTTQCYNALNARYSGAAQNTVECVTTIYVMYGNSVGIAYCGLNYDRVYLNLNQNNPMDCAFYRYTSATGSAVATHSVVLCGTYTSSSGTVYYIYMDPNCSDGYVINSIPSNTLNTNGSEFYYSNGSSWFNTWERTHWTYQET